MQACSRLARWTPVTSEPGNLFAQVQQIRNCRRTTVRGRGTLLSLLDRSVIPVVEETKPVGNAESRS